MKNYISNTYLLITTHTNLHLPPQDNFVAYSLERKLLDAQETSARRKKMKRETDEVRLTVTSLSGELDFCLCM